VASSQERLVPSSISSTVSSTCSEEGTTAAISDLSRSSSSSNDSSCEDTSSRQSHGGDDDEEEEEDTTCETRTLRDEQATPIMDPDDIGHYAGHRFLSQTQVGDYELVDNLNHHQHLSKHYGQNSPRAGAEDYILSSPCSYTQRPESINAGLAVSTHTPDVRRSPPHQSEWTPRF
jgi:hypothetical protein